MMMMMMMRRASHMILVDDCRGLNPFSDVCRSRSALCLPLTERVVASELSLLSRVGQSGIALLFSPSRH